MTGIEWVQSYVTENKIYCVYNAENKELIREHAKCGGFPADSVETVSHIIDGSWGETEKVKAAVTNLLSTPDYGSAVVSSDLMGIRPSGNPIDQTGMVAMLSGGDVEMQVNEVWSFDDIRFMGNQTACVVIAKSHQAFLYKGEQNDDVSTNTIVLEKESSGEWKVVRWQRSPGVAPVNASTPRQEGV